MRVKPKHKLHRYESLERLVVDYAGKDSDSRQLATLEPLESVNNSNNEHSPTFVNQSVELKPRKFNNNGSVFVPSPLAQSPKSGAYPGSAAFLTEALSPTNESRQSLNPLSKSSL